MLELAKIALRIKNNACDTEIQLLIDSCKAELGLAGINYNKKVEVEVDGVITEIMDPLIEQAILLYCKYNIGNSADAERFKAAYKQLKIALALSVEYEVV